jgi:hypothetical protein
VLRSFLKFQNKNLLLYLPQLRYYDDAAPNGMQVFRKPAHAGAPKLQITCSQSGDNPYSKFQKERNDSELKIVISINSKYASKSAYSDIIYDGFLYHESHFCTEF